MITRRNFVGSSALLLTTSIIGGGGTMPLPIAFADNADVTFEDTKGVNATLNVAVKINQQDSYNDANTWKSDKDLDGTSVGRTFFHTIKPGTNIFYGTSKNFLARSPYNHLLKSNETLDTSSFEITFDKPRENSFSWNSFNVENIPSTPLLYAPWYKAQMLARDAMTDEVKEDTKVTADSQRGIVSLNYIGSTNDCVAEAVNSPLAQHEKNLTPTANNVSISNFLFDIVPKAPGTAILYFSYFPDSTMSQAALFSYTNTSTSSSVLNLNMGVFAIKVNVGGGAQTDDKWLPYNSGYMNFCDQSLRSKYAYFLLADSKGVSFSDIQKCDSNTAFNEFKTSKLIDFSKPEFKISHWLSIGTAGGLQAGLRDDVKAYTNSNSPAITSNNPQAAVNEIRNSFFERCILSHARLFDCSTADIRSAQDLVESGNKILAKGTKYKESTSNGDGKIKIVENFGLQEVDASELVTDGLSSIPSETKFFKASALVGIDKVLQPNHEYALHFYLLPGYGLPYAENGTANSAPFDGTRFLKKDVIFRFRTMGLASKLELDKTSAVVCLDDAKADMQTAVVSAILKGADDQPASAVVDWTVDDSNKNYVELTPSADGKSVTVSAKAGCKGCVATLTATAKDTSGNAIAGATATCKIYVTHAFEKIAFKSLELYASSVAGSKLELAEAKNRPEFTLGGAPVIFSTENGYAEGGKYPLGLKWSSSNAAVATVDDNGTVTSMAAGDATIKVECPIAHTGTSYASATVIVKVRELASSLVIENAPTEAGKSIELATPESYAAGSTIALVGKLKTASNADVASDIAAITWTSSDTSVATVDASGKVTAKAAGTTTITASSDKSVNPAGVTATCAITVFPFATGLTLDKTSEKLAAPGIFTTAGTATITPTLQFPSGQTNAGGKVTVAWSSSNESVATVSNAGVVTAVKAGTSTITATASHPDGKISATCKITVEQRDPSFSFDKNSFELAAGTTAAVVAKWVNGGDYESEGITWTSSDEAVATVDSNGKITAKGDGSATITAVATKTKDETDDTKKIWQTCSVVVRTVPKTLTLDITSKTIDTKKKKSETATQALVASLMNGEKAVTLGDSNGTLEWKSSDAEIASVVGNGKDATVSAHKGGTATITVTYKAPTGSTLSWPKLIATCKIEVNDITPVKIALSETKVVMESPDGSDIATHKIVATALNSADKKLDDAVTFTSSDTAKVTVDADGTLKGVAAGIATITATCSEATNTCKVDVIILPKKVTLPAVDDLPANTSEEQKEAVKQIAELVETKKVLDMPLSKDIVLPDVSLFTVEPQNAGAKTIVWKASDPNAVEIKTVDGKIKAIAKSVARATKVTIAAMVEMLADAKIVTNGKEDAPAEQTPAPASLLSLITGSERAYAATDETYETPMVSFEVMVAADPALAPRPGGGSGSGTGTGKPGTGTDNDPGSITDTPTTPGTDATTSGGAVKKGSGKSPQTNGLGVEPAMQKKSDLAFGAAAVLLGAGAYAMHKINKAHGEAAPEGASDFGSFIESAATSLGQSVAKAKAAFVEGAELDAPRGKHTKESVEARNDSN